MLSRGTWRIAPVILLALSCAGSDSGGCGGGMMEPLPDGFNGTKSPNAAAFRLSPEGLQFIRANWQQLILNFLPGAKPGFYNPAEVELSFGMPCTDAGDVGWGVGHIFACDNGQGGPGTYGFMDGKCVDPATNAYNADNPCPILLTIESLDLSPSAPDKLEAQVRIRIDALKDLETHAAQSIYIDSDGSSSVCVWTKRLGCWANFYSARGSRPNEFLKVSIKLALDQNWDGQLTFELVPPDPNNAELIGGISAIEPGDLSVGGSNRLNPDGSTSDMCDYACDVVDWDFIKEMVFDRVVKPQLEQQIKQALATQNCRKCSLADATVPKCPSGSACSCPDGGSSCEDASRLCISDVAHGGRCVPMLLGLESRVGVGRLLADFGGDPGAKIDLFAAAGGPNTGSLQIGSSGDHSGDFIQASMMAGAKAVAKAACVPDLPAPAILQAPSPGLAAAGPAGHHLGLAVSEYFLDYAMYEAHRAGAMCVAITSQQQAMLHTGLFKSLLSSLGVVAGTETSDAPMMIVLRPLAAPALSVGAGNYDPVTKKPIPQEELLTLDMKDVRIDFYALIDDRFVRLFTLGADVKLPLSLIVEGCPTTILPALGDLRQMVVVNETLSTNSEILVEDPKSLASLIPLALGMAEPALAKALKPVGLPSMNGFEVKVDKLQGINRINTSPEFHYLGIYATLKLPSQCPRPPNPYMHVSVGGSNVPPAAELGPKNWPQAFVDVVPDPGEVRPLEYAWRVNGGLWSDWLNGPRLVVEHPAFLLQGRHRIEVRSRIAGDPATANPSGVEVEFAVDYDPPRLELKADLEKGRLLASARDAVTGDAALKWAWRVGEGAFVDVQGAPELELASLPKGAPIEVRVTDVSGHSSVATWNPSGAALAPPADEASAGCSSAAGGPLAFAALALASLLRRRRA